LHSNIGNRHSQQKNTHEIAQDAKNYSIGKSKLGCGKVFNYQLSMNPGAKSFAPFAVKPVADLLSAPFGHVQNRFARLSRVSSKVLRQSGRLQVIFV
jgi:hypothetical protein